MSHIVYMSESVTWSLLVWGLMVSRRELAATWGMSHHSDLCPDCDTIEPPPQFTASVMDTIVNVSAQCSKYFNAILRGSITAAAQKPPNSASCHQHTSPSLPRSAQRGAQLTIFVMGSHQTGIMCQISCHCSQFKSQKGLKEMSEFLLRTENPCNLQIVRPGPGLL